MKVVAQSLNRHQVHLRVVFPDLYKKIKDRYIDYQKTLRSQRRLRVKVYRVESGKPRFCLWLNVT